MKKENISSWIIKTLSLLFVCMFFSCERNVEEDNISEEDICDPEISFARDVEPIIDTRCLECHSGTIFPDLRTFSGITDNARSIQQQVVSREMPQGSTLPDDQIELISCWIDNGALDN